MEKIYDLIASIISLFNWIFVDWRNYNIKNNELVADLGCGGRPLVRANIIVDKFLEGTTERPTDFIDNGAYIIQCDLCRLPFKNKIIDFTYSSHVVEHLVNLDEALKEMQRVAKRGYITCPAALGEQIIAYKIHLWFVANKNGKLIFKRKNRPYPEYINDFFEKILASGDGYSWRILEKFEKRFSKEFYISYFWKDKINYEIIDSGGESSWKIEGELQSKDEKGLLLRIRERIIIYGSKITRFLFSKEFDIVEALCCPDCKGEIEIDDNCVTCKGCGAKFKHRDKRIFYFLHDISYL